MYCEEAALQQPVVQECLLQGRGEEGCNRPPGPTSLHRTEIAALVTFAAKLSSAIDVVERFERLDKAE